MEGILIGPIIVNLKNPLVISVGKWVIFSLFVMRPNNRSNRSSTAETSRFRSRSHRSFRPSTSDSARRNSSRRSQHQSCDVKQITVDTSNPTETVSEEYSLFSLPSGSRVPLLISVEINQVPIQMEVDTGASFTVISKQTYDSLFSSCAISQSKVQLKTYTGETL